MANPYSEDPLVEQPAIRLFHDLGWATVSAEDEVIGLNGTLGRDNKAAVVLRPRLLEVLARLNPTLPPETLGSAIDELARDRSAMSLAGANREVWTLLREGVVISEPDRDHGGQRTERLKVVDWDNPANNDFLLVSQLTVTGPLYTRRPDLVGFINGLPLLVVELKKPGVAVRMALDDNLTSYKSDIPQLFWSNALLVVSNGTDNRVGSLTADWGHYGEWKRIASETEPPAVSLEKVIRATCTPARLLDIAENFTVFSEHKSGLTKIVAQNHQFLGVNNALAALSDVRGQHGRLGVFWHTQGAGKSYSMVFFAQKVLRKVPGNWTFVVVTDRAELDDQIYRTFKAAGATSEHCQAESAANLRQLLGENHRYVFTLIHKFRTEAGAIHPVLSDRTDIIVLTDEAHRSQYDTLALNMRTALPNALFLAFTGTPLMAGEERTRDVFGAYISTYDFHQSVLDGATVPLYYENRTPELRLENPDLNEDIYRLIEESELDPAQESRLERELSKQCHLITRDDRLETVAKDIVQHFLGRGFVGKAMVVSIDKATALRMYDKVRKHWVAETTHVRDELAKGIKFKTKDASEKIQSFKARLKVLTETDMALVVSGEQNEIVKMAKLGLDIVPHRKRMMEEELDEKFKDASDPLRLVFVCAMWLTGFDAPSCSTVYLDKPMRNHSLMQTIARANRVFPGKHSGLIVDYANVFASLEKALAIYGQGRGGTTPVQDKKVILEELRKALLAATEFCGENGVELKLVQKAEGMERLALFGDAVNQLMAPDARRKDFIEHVRLVGALYRAVLPDPVASSYSGVVTLIESIADDIRLRTGDGPADITSVMGKISRLLDTSVAAEGYKIEPAAEEGDDLDARPGIVDLSQIDFEALRKRFGISRHKNIELEELKRAIRARLDKLILLNKSRVDYLKKFEELIESYNQGSRTVDELLDDLITLSQALTKEQDRHVREHLTEEELAIFDVLTRPGPALSPEEREEVKKVAKELLGRLRALLVIDWRKRSGSLAQVRIAIEDTLDGGLPRTYTPDLFKQKCGALFEHVFENLGRAS